MFTLEQIRKAHSKVKTGADFPSYIAEIRQLGVIYYETFVADGHTVFSGENSYKITSPAKYEILEIADQTNGEGFKDDLKAHQQGKTDYSSFCKQAARQGIEKWAVSMTDMTCSYFSKAGKVVLVEEIPVAG